MDWWLVLAVLLYLVAAVLLIAEVFIPSGGLISIAAMGSLVGGIYLFFRHSQVAGYIGVVLAVVLVPVVVIAAYRIFPHTKFGKTVMLTPQQRQAGEGVPYAAKMKDLMGAEGLVLGSLRPVGICEIGGKRFECIGESGFIEEGSRVKVVKVESFKVVVRKIES